MNSAAILSVILIKANALRSSLTYDIFHSIFFLIKLEWYTYIFGKPPKKKVSKRHELEKVHANTCSSQALFGILFLFLKTVVQ